MYKYCRGSYTIFRPKFKTWFEASDWVRQVRGLGLRLNEYEPLLVWKA